MLGFTNQSRLFLKLPTFSLDIQYKQTQIFQHRRHINNIPNIIHMYTLGSYNVLHSIFH